MGQPIRLSLGMAWQTVSHGRRQVREQPSGLSNVGTRAGASQGGWVAVRVLEGARGGIRLLRRCAR